MQKLVYAIAFVMAIVAPPQPLGICDSWKRTEICATRRENDRRVPTILVVRDGKVSTARPLPRPAAIYRAS